MQIHYYLGWFNNFFSEKLSRALKEDIIERKSLVMISSNPRLDNINGETERSWLDQAGILFEEYHLINYSLEKESALTIIQNASVIFLLGGDTITQNRFLIEYGLSEGIKKSNAIVMGASAGAINLSSKWLCSKNFGYDVEKSVIFEGIGLNDFSVLSHFDLENNMELVKDELDSLSNEMNVYVSNKDCALRIKGDQVDIHGDIFLISHSEIRKLNETF